jgi:hypothetical protein
MEDYKWVGDIPSSQLSNRALVLVCKFSRVLKKTQGRHLNLQAPHLAASVVRERQRTDSAELHSIFDELVNEFHLAAELSKKPSLSRGVSARKIDKRITRTSV